VVGKRLIAGAKKLKRIRRITMSNTDRIKTLIKEQLNYCYYEGTQQTHTFPQSRIVDYALAQILSIKELHVEAENQRNLEWGMKTIFCEPKGGN
jgi:hypothetical protein